MKIEAHGKSYEIEATGIVGRCAAGGKPYEPQLLERIHAEGLTGTAADVGAHVGNHTLYLAAICELEVVAFEPSKSVRELRRNVALNDLEDRVTVHRVALGAERGTGQMVGKGRVEAREWDSMMQEVDTTVDGMLEIHTLDSYDLADLAVIKIDVEGMEAQVIAGALKTIDRCSPLIYAETWGETYTAEVAELLEPLGYSISADINTATPVQEWRRA